ncbi:MAG TPA: ECF-type sigma factor [Vicinamibacterales bacterium]|nr:ECF-type sigma factor [Vicinamibacterales bacterium]
MATQSTRKAEVTRLLKEWREGQPDALDRLMPLVYDELRQMARIQLARERDRGRRSLQPTELVHEAFARLVDQRAEWQNRRHFFGIAARCMRRYLIDQARKKRAAKRPPAEAAIEIDCAAVARSSDLDTLLTIDRVLDRLAEQSPRHAQVAELKVFGGLEISEIAQILGVSVATVKRDWSQAKQTFTAFLNRRDAIDA